MLNFWKGNILHYEMNIDFSKSLDDQIYELNEDLAQVEYSNKYGNYILDIGWYPWGDPKGSIKMFLIKDGSWDNPEAEKSISDTSHLQKEIDSLIEKFSL